MKFLYPKLLVITLLTIIISACQTPAPNQPVIVDTPEPVTIGITPTEDEISSAFELESNQSWSAAAQAYLQIATKSSQPERSSFLIKSALMRYYAGDYADIPLFFKSLFRKDILDQDKPYKATLLAGAYLAEGETYQSLLTLPPISDIADHHYKILALKIRSKGVLAIGKSKASAELRMQISDYLETPEAIEENHKFIWDALNQITEASIVDELSKTQTKQMRGWLELNLIARRSNMLPAKIQPWIKKWYEYYSDHPASRLFALNLLEESKQIHIKPKRIALMLPFSGRLEKISTAIQNGFLYAYYQDQTLETEIDIIDSSSDISEFSVQYQQAIDKGAEVVVGPFDKNLIELLQSRQNLPVPTLALNYGDESKPTNFNLYQFGLRPEDEAEQIASYALAEGRYRAAILVPDTAWGMRLHQAFKTKFESLGGHVVGYEVYPSKKSDYSAAIKKLLNLTTSNLRKSMVEQLIDQPISFEPRRRQDVDMIFIAANSRQAKLIKPQLNFHRAQGLAVYATSHISSGDTNADNNRDLNDILFIDIPWMIDNKFNKDYKNISLLWPDDSKRFSRLFALGIDAYQLIPSLRRLRIHPEESVLRYTGLLSVDEKGRVKRKLKMATYKKGVVKLLQSPQPPTDLPNLNEAE